MNEHSATAGQPATRAPVFFWITVGVIGLFLIGGAAGAVLLVFQARSINQSGGWGWILVAGIYLAAIAIVCFASAVCTAVSLLRRERYRPLSIAILIVSGLVVLALAPFVIHVANGLRQQHKEAARRSAGGARRPIDPPPPATNAPAVEKSATPVNANPQVLELKAIIWEAIRSKNAGAFVDCFYIEQRFNTPEVREENRKQVEILLRGETVDVEIREIPARELAEIMKIQKASPASAVRYSLVPKMMLRVWQGGANGRVGRSFLIGEQNGKWYIITMAGHTT